MEITLDKTFSNLHIGESELNQARTSNDKVGIAYGDAQKISPSFHWTPLRMIAHDQSGEIY